MNHDEEKARRQSANELHYKRLLEEKMKAVVPKYRATLWYIDAVKDEQGLWVWNDKMKMSEDQEFPVDNETDFLGLYKEYLDSPLIRVASCVKAVEVNDNMVELQDSDNDDQPLAAFIIEEIEP